jgi:hypothetical protein
MLHRKRRRMARNRRNMLALAGLSALLGCASSHLPDRSEDEADTPAGAVTQEGGHLRNVHGEGDVQVTWSVAPEDLPPSMEGAREVVTSAAHATFQASIGHFLQGQPAVYKGKLAASGDGLTPLPESESFATLVHLRNISRPNARPYVLLHEFYVYDPLREQRARLRQEGVLSNAPPAAWLLRDGLGAAEIALDIAADGTLPAGKVGMCFGCMTSLGDPGDNVDTIVLDASELDPADGASRPVTVDGSWQRIAPEDLGPSELAGASCATAAHCGPNAQDLFDGFEAVAPGRFERESPSPSTTRVRCSAGGSRSIVYRTTWRIQLGDVARSGIGDIEVIEARPCESINIGGGS